MTEPRRRRAYVDVCSRHYVGHDGVAMADGRRPTRLPGLLRRPGTDPRGSGPSSSVERTPPGEVSAGGQQGIAGRRRRKPGSEARFAKVVESEVDALPVDRRYPPGTPEYAGGGGRGGGGGAGGRAEDVTGSRGGGGGSGSRNALTAANIRRYN